MTSNKRHLLVVEDDKGLQSQLRWAFEGYEVAIAGDHPNGWGVPRFGDLDAGASLDSPAFDCRCDPPVTFAKLGQVAAKFFAVDIR